MPNLPLGPYAPGAEGAPAPAPAVPPAPSQEERDRELALSLQAQEDCRAAPPPRVAVARPAPPPGQRAQYVAVAVPRATSAVRPCRDCGRPFRYDPDGNQVTFAAFRCEPCREQHTYSRILWASFCGPIF